MVSDQVEVMMTMFADYIGSSIKEARAYAAGFMDGAKMIPTLPPANGELRMPQVDVLAKEVAALITELTGHIEAKEEKELSQTLSPSSNAYFTGFAECQKDTVRLLEGMMEKYNRGAK